MIRKQDGSPPPSCCSGRVCGFRKPWHAAFVIATVIATIVIVTVRQERKPAPSIEKTQAETIVSEGTAEGVEKKRSVLSIKKGDPRPLFPVQDLTVIRRDGTRLPFKVEVAVTPEQQAYGLMFQESLPERHGMLFLYMPPQKTAFWMKNTPIPLDIIFIRLDYKIVKIVKNARPFDETSIPSGEPVLGVLELGGGETERLNIQVGDRIL